MAAEHRTQQGNGRSSPLTPPASLIWVLTAILLAAAALRLLGIAYASPPGLAHDEVANWLIDRLILAGDHAVYFTRAYGHEAGYHYWQALLVALIGDNPLALRLASGYLGLLGTAVTFALARKLFGWRVGVLALGITAVLFFPVFYSRLGLRAIMLPVFSGLSAVFWWQAWRASGKGAAARKKSLVIFALAGLFAGLSLYTYMAARAVPIFYGLFGAYLAAFHWRAFKQRWRGAALFVLVFVLTAAPLVYYLLANPGSEYRISELDAPLRALLAGDLGPILTNGAQILLGFGVNGDPLWRQGVAGMPIFGPVVALLFYASLPLCLWRWRDARYGFLLLWLATAVLPSLVTINAPSTIRMINLLPVLGIFPAIVIHNIPKLSTVIPGFSTSKAKISTIVLLIFAVVYAGWTIRSIYVIWPRGGDVAFVWQTALRDMGAALDDAPAGIGAAVGGWSPDTMDPSTMALMMTRDDVPLSTFGIQPGDNIIHTLVIPSFAGKTAVFVLHPTDLPLNPLWHSWLEKEASANLVTDTYTQYDLHRPPDRSPKTAVDAVFGDQLQLVGVDRMPDGLITYWQVTAPITQPIRLFVHVLDHNGEIIAEDYRWDTEDPQHLWQPHWQVGDLIWQYHPLPQNLPGAAQIRLGLFNPYSCSPGPCQNMPTATGEPFVLLPAQE